MEKIVDEIGKLGSALGVLAGLIEMSIGTKILSWIGNKENPAILGIITILLSVIAFVSVRSADKHINPTNDRKLATFLGIFIPAAICFTTVGRLWYLPGTLIIVTSLFLGYEYWFCKSNVISPKIVSRKLGANQIIGWFGSLMILVSVMMALFNSSFGLLQTEILVKSDLFRFEILPMDIVRVTNLSGSIKTVEDIEVSLVMIVYIFLILGATIALISSLVKSRIFMAIGGLLVFTGLALLLFWLPGILAQTEFPSVRLQNIFESLGIGWYISIVGMSLITITSLFQIQPGNTKSRI